MTVRELVEQVKINVGITSDKLDFRIESLVQGIIDEVDRAHGIKLDTEKVDHALFIIDYASHRYKSKVDAIPPDIMWRLKHLYLENKDVQS